MCERGLTADEVAIASLSQCLGCESRPIGRMRLELAYRYWSGSGRSRGMVVSYGDSDGAGVLPGCGARSLLLVLALMLLDEFGLLLALACCVVE